MNENADVLYEVEDGLAWITINRPDRFNAFRARTVDELIDCFKRAWADSEVGVVASPAPVTARSAPAATRSSAPRPATTGRRRSGLFEVEYLHRADPRDPQAGDRARSTATRSAAGTCCTCSAI